MEAIRDGVDRVVRHYEENPDAGREPDSAATAVREGLLRFRVSGPHGEVVTDIAKSVGGGETAPTPGWTMRAALAACDASVVAIEAARAGVELSRLEVTVTGNSDIRGTLGMDESVPAGPLDLQVRIEIASDDATEDQLREIVRLAEQRSPVGDAVARAIPVTTQVVVG